MTGWRVPIRVALFWVGYIAILLLGSFPRNMAPPSWAQAVWVVWGAVLVYAMTVAFVRLEGRSLREVGFGVDAATVLRFALGLLSGAALYTVTRVTVSVVTGGIHVEKGGGFHGAAPAFVGATFVVSACMEGFGFRGYPQHTLQRRFGVWPAVITAAFFFALSHIAFGWSWNDVLLGVFPNGVLFGMVTVASRGLAMPTALHAAINLSQWSFGEDGGTGPWKIVVDPSALARVQAVAPLMTLAVYALAIFAAWKWYRRTTACRPLDEALTR
jgi:membrane protease YdiL (CAAX protease family)